MVQETTKSKKRQFITVEQDGSDMSSDDASSGMESDHAPIKKLQGRKALLARQSSSSSSSDQKESLPSHPSNASVTPRNKQRVLLISSRGITYRFRHLLNDLHALFPHSKKDSKLDLKTNLQTLNELAELANCNNCVYFEVKRHSDLYMWISKTPNGPSAKLYVQNVHTMDELKMTGNCLKGSRPLLSFDKGFDSEPHWMLMKELLTQTFGTPKTSRKIKPFFDHVLSFTIADNRIWFRNYQIIEKTEGHAKVPEISLVEIGPRFVMNIVRLFDGSFGGSTLYENPGFVSPASARRLGQMTKEAQYRSRMEAAQKRQEKAILNQLPKDPLADVFE